MRASNGYSRFSVNNTPCWVLIILVVFQMSNLTNVHASEIPVMDMRVRQGDMTTDGSTVELDIWVDLRTTDGSNWRIIQIQNSLVLDPHFQTLVTQVDTSDWAFMQNNYTTHFRYTPQAGVIEFAANHKVFMPSVSAGGPDSLTWFPAFKFTIQFEPDPGQTGTIEWYGSTPYMNIRAINESVESSVTIHRDELGAPINVPLEFICYTDLELQLACEQTELVIGDSGSYTISVYNLGDCDATGVGVSNALPVLLGFDYYTTTTGSYSVQTGLWDLGSLAVGDSAKLTVFFDARFEGNLYIEGTVSSLDQTDPNPGNNGAQVPIHVDRLKIMDMRVRKGEILGQGSTGIVELYFDVRTIDGSSRMITQLQNAIQFDPLFNSLVTSVELVECEFTEQNYSRFWRWADADAVLEFQFAHKDFMDFVSLGGPDSSDWHTILKFNVHYNVVPDEFATINWFHDTPHYNVRALSIPPGRTEVIHNERTGTPLVFKIDNFVDLQVDLQATRFDGYVGDTVTFNSQVTNIGNLDATGVQVSTILPAGFLFLQHSATQGTFDPQTGQWEIGTLEPGHDCTLEIEVELIASGQISTVSQITHVDQPDSDLSNNSDNHTLSVTLGLMDMRMSLGNFHSDGDIGTVELNLDVRTVDGSAQFIEQIQNSVVLGPHFRNLVTTVDATNWALDDESYSRYWEWFPTDGVIEFMSTHLMLQPAIALGGPDAETWHNVVTFTISFDMDSTQQGQINWFDDTPHFNVRGYSEPGQPSEIINRDELGGPISLPLYMREADIALDQSVDIPAPQRGDRIVLSLGIENAGPTVATDILVSHDLPTVLSIVSTNGDGTYDVQSKQWTIDQLEVSQRAEMDVTVDVEQAGLFASVLDIQAFDQIDPDSTNDHSVLLLPVGNTVMDMRLNLVKLTGNGTTVFAELSVDVRTIDGSSRLIQSMQNSFIFDEQLCAAVTGVTVKEWQLPADDYLCSYEYTEMAGVLEFQTVVKEFGEPVSFGGPDSTVWSPVVVFELELQAMQDQVGEMDWYDHTPHFNVRAATLDLSDTENIQRTEMGCPVQIPLDYRSQANLTLGLEAEDLQVVQYENVLLHFSLENNGPNDGHDVQVRHAIPAGLEFLSWSGDGTYDPQTGDWTVGDLYAGASIVMDMELVANNAGDFKVESGVTDLYEFDPDTSDNHVELTVNVMPAIKIFMRAYLEGAYRFAIQIPNHPDPELMATSLRYSPISGGNCLIPLKSPYADSLFRDPGVTDPNDLPEDIVDWVFVQLRSAEDPGSPDLVLGNGVAGVSCFLRNDGALIDVDGSEGVLLPGIAEGSYYFIIDHRNHLKVMSAVPVNTLEMTEYNFDGPTKHYYDFTEAREQFFTVSEDDQRGCHLEPINQKWCIGAGDADKAHQVENTDFDIWHEFFGSSAGYFLADYDLGGMVEGYDQNLVFDNLLLRSPFSWLDIGE